MSKKATRQRISRAISDSLWSIEPEWLDKIMDIHADNLADEIKALETRTGTSFSFEHPDMQRYGGDNIAVITSTGPIFYRAGMLAKFSGAESITSLAKQYGAAEEDEAVTDIVLNFESSPGGQVAGIVEFADRISRSEKRIWSYVGNMAASAHYVIASAADRVYVSPTAYVGNVGVVASVRKSEGDGTYEVVSSRTPLKRIDPESEQGRARIQARVDETAQVLFERVGMNLGVDPESIARWQGETFMGAKAVEAGAAYAVTTFDDLIAEISANAEGTSRSYSMPGKSETVAVADVTAEWFAENKADERPKLFERFGVKTSEQHKQGVDEALDTERVRIQACLEVLNPEAKELFGECFAMLFDGKSQPGDVALKIVNDVRKQESAAKTDYDAGNDLPEPINIDSRRAKKGDVNGGNKPGTFDFDAMMDAANAGGEK